jgi:CheY-like chemotaxis protein
VSTDYSGVQILLAEDDPIDAEMTMSALRNTQPAAQLHWVKDGSEAVDFIACSGAYLDRAGGRNPRLILLDLKMPKMDGVEVLRWLKQDARTRPIPVVMLTSSNEDRDVAECYRLGVNSYIVKPVDYYEYADTVARLGAYWLRSNRSLE